jgi:hypothetical protein
MWMTNPGQTGQLVMNEANASSDEVPAPVPSHLTVIPARFHCPLRCHTYAAQRFGTNISGDELHRVSLVVQMLNKLVITFGIYLCPRSDSPG